MKQTLLLFLVIGLFSTCGTSSEQQASSTATHVVAGKTMGTYYRVSYVGAEKNDLQKEIDSLLLLLDFELSTYNKKSVISKVNKGKDFQSITESQTTGHFIENFQRAKQIYQLTNGFFDPSVMPLVNYWGFGYDPNAMVKKVDSITVDSIRQLVGFDKINMIKTNGEWTITKENIATQIDFSAIAKGYGVDQLAALLKSKGFDHFLVDIGGEVVGAGVKPGNIPWTIGIAVPVEDTAPSDYMAAIAVENVAIATSGNYRNFHEINGVKYSHTINPFSGFPERSQLLSASICAKDCATADALATACMVAGLDKGFAMIDSMPNLEGYFIYSDDNGKLLNKATEGFPQRFK